MFRIFFANFLQSVTTHELRKFKGSQPVQAVRDFLFGQLIRSSDYVQPVHCSLHLWSTGCFVLVTQNGFSKQRRRGLACIGCHA